MVLNFLERFFPNSCTSCGARIPVRNFLCEHCENQIKGPLLENFSISYINKTYAFWWYEPPMNDLIKAYKFQGRFRLAEQFAEMLFKMIFKFNIDGTIIPVPTTFSALRKRGFDTNALILKKLNRKLDITVLNALTALRRPMPQSRLSGNDRVISVKGKFQLVNSTLKLPERVILFDDVITTGATVSRMC
ncbi:ComF family protein [Kosmotoga sp. DU53]|uniref:ComF family protein n=1 Tax=Kosmotoga sp. DU53 TaxID=1310160 RepID=UPI0007D80B58|nr:ComF family protein [Kosmotoga sp. DU53]OAA22482.1 hypothetical protein DU53_04080 [Kosmotoga sp. DU53]